MRLLDALVNDAQADVRKRTRRNWTEADYKVALDLRLTGEQAGKILGCSSTVVYNERREWSFEWWPEEMNSSSRVIGAA